jgi:hypothetical protein
MTDLSGTIAPKSDQLNSDDLIAGPRTIRVTRVSADPSSAEQPVCIFFEGDGGKPYKPCKSMRRVLVACWGADGSAFSGRSMTLYRDPSVTWGGMEVGGIRISHLSHIDGERTMALTATKKARKPYTVKPLVADAEPTAPLLAPDGRLVHVKQRAWLGGVQKAVAAMEDAGALSAWRAAMGEHFAAIIEAGGGDVVKQAEAEVDARMASFGAPADDFPGNAP